jgi:hypothetical protein
MREMEEHLHSVMLLSQTSMSETATQPTLSFTCHKTDGRKALCRVGPALMLDLATAPPRGSWFLQPTIQIVELAGDRGHG